MRAAYLVAPRKLELRDVERPTPGPGEVLLRIEASLTCGTDLKAWRRGHPVMPFPTPLGHEFAGVVAAAGPGPQPFPEGTPLMSVHTAPCGQCHACRRQANLCPAAMEGMVVGSYADYLLLPAHVVRVNAYVKPDELSWTEAAFLEPLSCVVQGARKVAVEQGESVAIIGAGAIGLLHLLEARRRGASRVVLLDREPSRLETALGLGAHGVVQVEGEQTASRLRRSLEGRGADAVIECAGQPDAWELAPELARRGGRVLWFGGCPGGTTVRLDTGRIHYDELTLMGSFHFTPDAVREAQGLLASGAIRTSGLISGTLPLDEVVQAFENLDQGLALKYALLP